MGMGIENSGIGKNGNGDRFLSWEWVGIGMGMFFMGMGGNGNRNSPSCTPLFVSVVHSCVDATKLDGDFSSVQLSSVYFGRFSTPVTQPLYFVFVSLFSIIDQRQKN